jgi:hypothetical protein
MAWVTPATRSDGYTVPASQWNQDVVANAIYLKSAIAAHFVMTAAGLWPHGVSGCEELVRLTVGYHTFSVLPFLQGVTTYANAQFVLPADYNGGVVTAKFHWTANSTSANTAIWGIQGYAMADGDTLNVTAAGAQEVTDTNGTSVYTLRISPATASMTIQGGPAANEWCCWRVYRKGASDTLAATAYLLGVQVTYSRS